MNSLIVHQRMYVTRQIGRVNSEVIKPQAICGVSSFSIQPQPGDILAYAPLTLQNVVAGSEYWVAQSSDLTNVIALGTAPGGDIVINVPLLSVPFAVTIRVRKGTSGIRYLPFETQAQLTRSGGVSYVIQTIDTIAS